LGRRPKLHVNSSDGPVGIGVGDDAAYGSARAPRGRSSLDTLRVKAYDETNDTHQRKSRPPLRPRRRRPGGVVHRDRTDRNPRR
jgi:hypothetical protein